MTTPPSSVRVLPWRDAPRRINRNAALLLAAGLMCAPTFMAARGTDTPGATPGSLVRLIRDAKSIHVEAVFQYRLYKQFEGDGERSVKADGGPTFGTVSFREQGAAWRVQNEIDRTRMPSFWSVDTAFDGDRTEVTNHRCEQRAWMTEAGEYGTLFSQSRNPLFWLAAWTDPDPTTSTLPITRSSIRAIPDSLLSLADAGWTTEVFEGAQVDVNLVEGGPNGMSYAIVTPHNQHDHVLFIDQHAPGGALALRIRFDDWKIPAWGETSQFTPRALPQVVTVIGYLPSGEPQFDVTLSISSCSIDVPIPVSDMKVSLDGAQSLFHLDLGTRIW